MSLRSAQQVSTQPPAMAWPLTAATTGFGRKHGVKRPVQDWQELAYIVAPARTYPDQVDARRKHAALSCDHDGAYIRSAKLFEAFHQRFAQIDVECIGLTMRYGNDRNAVVGFKIDHDRLHPRKTTCKLAGPAFGSRSPACQLP
jgi:hypothetical protein